MNKPQHWVYALFGWWQNLNTGQYGKPKPGDYIMSKGDWILYEK